MTRPAASGAAVADVPGGCVLAVRVIPRARQSAFDGERDGRWLVRLAAPPVDGAANEALIALCAEQFAVAKRAVRIISGERAREKRVQMDGRSASDVRAMMARRDAPSAPIAPSARIEP